MEKTKRISVCPQCGADVRHIDPASITENKCPYCDFELYNHSREIYDEKIEDVKKAKSKLISRQIIIAIVAAVLILFVAVFVLNRTAYRSSHRFLADKSDKMTESLERAYAKEDWDKMYDLLIVNADKGLTSPYYFSYRAAYIMYLYVPTFDEAVENNDIETMTKAFEEVGYEYEYREQLSEVYKFVPEIEEKLEKEYLREKEIMQSHGLLD